ncbi:MAG: hypothetical protein H6855_04700 [Rhodospirillales bacterium]|nr:hypothetical protein [Rhodospirillales bacterium]MCB9973257.1 hypothetical protein [Rhodospirillales bacterium]
MRRHIFTFLAASVSLAGLTACTVQDIYGPSSRPRGYAHYAQEYKTVIPERPPFIGESYSDEEVMRSEELWSAAVKTLLDEMEKNSVISGLSVALEPSVPVNSFDVRMDYYLRKELKQRGYLISTEPLATIPVLRYSARLPGYRDGLQQRGRAIDTIDDIQNQFDVQEDPKNNGEPYVFMGLGIYDMSAPKKEQLLVFVETLQTLPEKDMREIRGALVDVPNMTGKSPSSNLRHP